MIFNKFNNFDTFELFFCSKRFHIEYQLRAHVKNTHEKQEMEVCEYCAKQFK